ncbi:hypothetical protein LK10_04295 [Sinomonas humi]|uniref:Glyoxalase-like domain-containing protein n=1 Tax=Sinomonas humi TaxID=1338436 RepID=A0A0B2ARV9_9MICC|nr:hypothetical protein LK10_04295 [Sinomonas humi]
MVGSDPGWLQAFYRDASGWGGIHAGPAYPMVHPGGGGTGGGAGAAPERSGSWTCTDVGAGGLHEAPAGIEELGRMRALGPVDVPNGPVALFADPQGQVIGLTVASTGSQQR